MTSSSSVSLTRGLDTMLVVYSLLQGHPAATPCEQFLRNQTGWFTTPLVLFEARAVLVKVYGTDPVQTTHKLTQLAQGPVTILDLTPTDALAALAFGDAHQLDLTDAALLLAAQHHSVQELATEDLRLRQVCVTLGIATTSPVDAVVRQQIDVWEASHLAPKGLARTLRSIQHWLSRHHPQTAIDFWSRTGNGSHLP